MRFSTRTCIPGVEQLRDPLYQQTVRELAEKMKRGESMAHAEALLITNHISMLEQRITKDLLTGLDNGEGFRQELEHVAGRAARPEYWGDTFILYADLDGFSEVNNLLGHSAGDAAIRSTAEYLDTLFLDGDKLARPYGTGDEFAAVLYTHKAPGDIDLVVIPSLTRRMETIVRQYPRFMEAAHPELKRKGIPLGMSIGLAQVERNLSVEVAVQRAEEAMYHAKNQQLGFEIWRPGRGYLPSPRRERRLD